VPQVKLRLVGSKAYGTGTLSLEYAVAYGTILA
jgi:hypothetical protein